MDDGVDLRLQITGFQYFKSVQSWTWPDLHSQNWICLFFGLELSVKYFQSSKYRKNSEVLYILCDCSSAIDVIVDRMYAATGFEYFTRLSYLEGILSEMNVTIALAWIPGHEGIPVNELQIIWQNILHWKFIKDSYSATCFVTYNDAVRIATDTAKKTLDNRRGIKMFPDIIPDSSRSCMHILQ